MLVPMIENQFGWGGGGGSISSSWLTVHSLVGMRGLNSLIILLMMSPVIRAFLQMF
jgi:hypothetical protein